MIVRGFLFKGGSMKWKSFEASSINLVIKSRPRFICFPVGGHIASCILVAVLDICASQLPGSAKSLTFQQQSLNVEVAVHEKLTGLSSMNRGRLSIKYVHIFFSCLSLRVLPRLEISRHRIVVTLHITDSLPTFNLDKSRTQR